MRTGDVVHHGPSGEDWLVAWADAEHVYPCGWPPCRAAALDCTLVKAATDEEHQRWLQTVAQSGHSEARKCRAALAALGVEVPSE